MAKNNIKADTMQLKELLSKAEETGLIAWRVGEAAYRIKENKSFKDLGYLTFDDYSTKELGKGEVTINIYIKIYQSFEIDEVGSMLFTHLKEFVKIKDVRIRKVALETFRKLRSKFVKEADIKEKEQIFTALEVEKVAKIISASDYLSDEAVENIIQEVLKVKQQKEATKPNKFGKDFNYPKFTSIKELIACEPIDEQGTVALFCLLFDILRNYQFPLKLSKTTTAISFHKVKFIRSRFPDACIVCRQKRNTYEFDWDVMVEFEYLSESYTSHLMSKEPCQLIICWEDNINRNVYQGVPPIISLKDFLETGEIKLK